MNIEAIVCAVFRRENNRMQAFGNGSEVVFYNRFVDLEFGSNDDGLGWIGNIRGG